MDLKELRRKVHKELSLYYIQHGFDLDKKKGLFIKGVFNVLWGVSAKYSTCIYFRPSFSINNVNINKVLSEIFPEQKNLTIYKVQGRDLAREFNCNDYDYLGDKLYDIDQGASYKVDEKSDIRQIVTDHIQYMEKVGFSFFDQLSSVEGINNFINNRIIEVDQEIFDSLSYRKKLEGFFDKREVLSGVVSAFLINNQEIQLLLVRYRDLFQDNDYILADVEKIVHYFRKHQEV